MLSTSFLVIWAMFAVSLVVIYVDFVRSYRFVPVYALLSVPLSLVGLAATGAADPAFFQILTAGYVVLGMSLLLASFVADRYRRRRR